MASPYSYHFSRSPNHKHVWALGAERIRPDGWLAGASYFSNSFGQPSGYVYVGKTFPNFLGYPKVFAQASGGVMYGYRKPFAHKVPFNENGWSPGALLTLGYEIKPDHAVAVHLLGFAGLMFQYSVDFR